MLVPKTLKMKLQIESNSQDAGALTTCYWKAGAIVPRESAIWANIAKVLA